MIRRLFFVAFTWGLICSCVFAQQGSSAALNGTVTDSQGAVIPGAVVVVTENSTNVASKTVTTGGGEFNFPTLPPGEYRLAVKSKGFSEGITNGITLRVAQKLTINVKLLLGESTESVQVTADAALLETSTAQLSHYVTAKELQSWPLPVTHDGERELSEFVLDSLPGTSGNSWTSTLNGGQYFSNEIYLDGVSLGTFDTAEIAPSVDAVSQFNMQVGAMGAQYNGGGTTVTNYSLRSGTNSLHGSAYEFNQNEVFNANTYSNNQSGTPRPKDRLNTYGGTIGGPIYIPKLYDGRNKSFFFFAFEKSDIANFTTSGNVSVPTTSMRAGDLSGFLNPGQTLDPRSGKPAVDANGNPVVDALGRQVIFGQIYDPATQRQVTQGQVDPQTGLIALSTGLVRDTLAGNVIPGGRFDPVAANYLKLKFPSNFVNNQVASNVPGLAGNQPTFNQEDVTVKLDHELTESQKVSFVFTTIVRDRSNGSGWAPPGASPLDGWFYQHNPGKIIRVNDYWTIKPNVLNYFGLGYNRFSNFGTTPFYNQNWASTLGIQNTAKIGFPTIGFGGSSGALLGGSTYAFGNGDNGGGTLTSSVIGIDQLTFNIGRHQVEAGTEWRFYRENDENISTPGGFSFNNQETDDGLTTTSYTGNAFASFLLGQVDSTSRTIYAGNDEFNRRLVDTFVQDDWKILPKLTLNLGIRWEVVGGMTEARGQMTTTNPFLPNSGAGNLPGALQFAGQLGRKGFESTDWGMVLPRVGFAYAVSKATVLRGGFGINTQAPEAGPAFHVGFGGPGETPSTLGYSGTIQVNHSTNPQQFPDIAVAKLSDPYPSFTGILPNYDPTQANGQAPPAYIRPDGARINYIENYNLGIQQALGNKTIGEINYVGNTGKRLGDGALGQLNQLPYGDLAKYGGALLEPLSLHPEIPLPYTGFSTNNTVAQALLRFPQYAGGGFGQYDYLGGWSRYDSLQATITRQVSHGFNLIAAYTWSKAMTNTNSNCEYSGNCTAIQDVAQPQLEKAVATGIFIPQQFKFTTFYNLPFGPARRFALHGPAQWIAGGWTVSANLQYQSGGALAISDSGVTNGLFSSTRPNYTGLRVKLGNPGRVDTVHNKGPQYLNPAAFTHVPTTTHNLALTTGNVPSALGTVQAPGLASENASLQKNFDFKESRSFQLRIDAINLFNRAGLGSPVTDINSPTFGQILGTQYSPRILQLAGRISF